MQTKFSVTCSNWTSISGIASYMILAGTMESTGSVVYSGSSPYSGTVKLPLDDQTDSDKLELTAIITDIMGESNQEVYSMIAVVWFAFLCGAILFG